MIKRNAYLFVLMAGMILLATACDGSSDAPQKKPDATLSAAGKAPADTLLKNVNARQLQEVIESYKGHKAVLVNVWATWCVPCVEEFPEIVRLQRLYPGELQVLFISADFPEDRQRAVQFLKDHGVDWTTYFKDAKDEPFINALSADWSGALPFTKVIHRNGDEVAHWENKATFDTFNEHVQQAIKP